MKRLNLERLQIVAGAMFDEAQTDLRRNNGGYYQLKVNRAGSDWFQFESFWISIIDDGELWSDNLEQPIHFNSDEEVIEWLKEKRNATKV